MLGGALLAPRLNGHYATAVVAAKQSHADVDAGLCAGKIIIAFEITFAHTRRTRSGVALTWADRHLGINSDTLQQNSLQ
jgi:hypothetical protein